MTLSEPLKRAVKDWCREKFIKNCPKILTVEEIDAIATDIHEAEEAIIELRQRLEEKILQLRDKIEDKEQLADAASYVYWTLPEISAVCVTRGTTGSTHPKTLWKFIRPIGGFYCPICKSEILVEDRESLYKAIKGEFRSARDSLCKKCESEDRKQWPARNEAILADENRRRQEKLERINELRSMPYQEYLQTIEWRERRTRHVESAGHACQVCNARNVQLNVHHRTYERRGAELYQDLIVLCRDCHTLFHRNGKLVKYFQRHA